MPSFTTTIDEQGRVALPTELVRRLGLRPGETVEFFLTLDGQVHFHVINGDWSAGPFKPGSSRPPLSIREIDDTIADHLAQEDARILSQPRPAGRTAAE